MSLSEIGHVAERPTKKTMQPITRLSVTEMVLRLGTDYISKAPPPMYFHASGALHDQVKLREDLGIDSLDAAQLFLDMGDELPFTPSEPEVAEGADDVTMGDLYKVCQVKDA